MNSKHSLYHMAVRTPTFKLALINWTTSYSTLKVMKLSVKLKSKDMRMIKRHYKKKLPSTRRSSMIRELLERISTLRWGITCLFKKTSFLNLPSIWTFTRTKRTFTKREKERIWLRIMQDWLRTIRMLWKKVTCKILSMNTRKPPRLEPRIEMDYCLSINNSILKSKSQWIKEIKSKTRCKSSKNCVSQLLRKTSNCS